ncbi:hypothetical protein JNK62_04080 [bacterium]|nr:hypothetical protein [bacterium]
MASDDILKRLFVSESAKYGDKYIEHLLEQYKIYVESSEKISDRRQKSNEFFLALNTALVGLLGFMSTRSSEDTVLMLLVFSSIAGAVMCYFWYEIIKSYRNLNTAKFQVIHAIESRLPLSLYDTEWEALGRGEDTSKYWPFSHIELSIPWIFIGLYALLFLSSLCA